MINTSQPVSSTTGNQITFDRVRVFFYANWEMIAYIVIFVLAVLTRFVNLGDRVVSHDESLHTKFSWDLYRTGQFQHTPLMHGPVLFHMTAFFYMLFGDNDYTARIYPAILSVLMVMFPILWKRWLGNKGALITSVLFLISPMLMYYGRYIREDTPSIFFTLIMFYAIFQYVDGTARVRGKPYWLYIMAAGMLLSLASKEVGFFYVAIFGSFLTLFWAIQMAQRYLKLHSGRTLFYLISTGLILGGIASLVMVAIFTIIPTGQIWSTEGGFHILNDPYFSRMIVWTLGLVLILAAFVFGTALWARRGNGHPFPWREVAIIVLVTVLSCAVFLIIEEATRIEPALAAPANPEEEATITTEVRTYAPIILSWIVGAAVVVLAIAGRFLGFWDQLKEYKVFDVLILMGSLILPWLTAIAIYATGAKPTDYSPEGIRRAMLAFIPFAGVAIAVGLSWNWRVWLTATGIFLALFAFFFTTMFTNGQGLASGMIGSLGYWLEQQEVRRGNQPQYYYLLLTPFYEFLPLIGAIAAGAFGLTQFWRFVHRKGEHEKVKVEDGTLEYVETPAGEPVVALEGPADATVFSGARQTEAVDVPALAFEAVPGDPFAAGTVELEMDGGYLPAETVENVPPEERLSRVPFLLFVGYWAVLVFMALTLSGEKMPWLTTHITVPLCLLAGWYGGRILDSISVETFRRHGWKLLLATPVFLVALRQVIMPWLTGEYPFQGLAQVQLEQTGAWLAAFAVAAGMIYVIAWVFYHVGWAQTWRTLVAGIGVLLMFITLRFALMASFINYDYATEFLVYAHSGPAFRTVMNTIEDISRRTTDGLNLRVAYGDEAWPSSWYFRNFRNAQYFGSNPSVQLLDDAIAVVVSDAGRARVEPLLGDRYYRFDYIRMWWPMQDYFNLTIDRIDNAFDLNPANATAAQIRRGIWDIWWNRDYDVYGAAVGTNYDTAAWPVSDRMHLYVRKDVAAQIWDMGVGAEVVTDFGSVSDADVWAQRFASLVWGQEGTAPGQLNHPRDLDIGGDGWVYVADTGNSRIQVFSAAGEPLFSWGSLDSVGDDGQAANGLFAEPWGVAVASDGTVYVADTWNHRVQVFTPDGEFIRGWGQFAQLGSAGGPTDFWGPRDIAVDAQGLVYVADTGNKRVRVYTAEGEWVRDIGSGDGGTGAGQLNEPVGLAIHSDGRLFVADTWNRRIQVFDAFGQYLTSWMVNAWYGSDQSSNRPYIALDEARGHLYVTDPDASRVLVYNLFGTLLGSFGQAGIEPLDASQFTAVGGIDIDDQGYVYISDAGSSRILRFDPWEEIAVQQAPQPEATEEVTEEPTEEVAGEAAEETEAVTEEATEEVPEETPEAGTDEVPEGEGVDETTAEPTEDTTAEATEAPAG